MKRSAIMGATVVIMLAATACSSIDDTPPITSDEPPAGAPQQAGGDVMPMGCAATTTPASGQLYTSGGDTSARELQQVLVDGQPLADVLTATGGTEHMVALLGDGTVLAWGDNIHGQLGSGDHETHTTPRPVAAPDGRDGVLDGVVELSADSDVTVARRGDGSVVVWGRGEAGQRGNETTEQPPYPTTVLNADGDGPLADIVRVSADGRTLAALQRDGTVLTWGVNRDGQLGDGTHTDRTLPAAVVGIDGRGYLHATDLAAGGQHMVALLPDGRVVTWGSNSDGQLGDGTFESRTTPNLVIDANGEPMSGVVAVMASELTTYALLNNGEVAAWGLSEGAQIGDGIRDQARPQPSRVLASDVACISAGEAFVAALHSDGSVSTWGSGGRGQLAAGAERERLIPGSVIRQDGVPVTDATAVGTAERQLFVIIDEVDR